MNKKQSEINFMDLRKLINKVVCNEREKNKLFKDGFVKETNTVFDNYLKGDLLEEEEILSRLEIISLLSNTKNKKQVKEIYSSLDLYFKLFMGVIDKIVDKEIIDIPTDFTKFYENINKENTTETCKIIESDESEVYKEFEWINTVQNRARMRRRNFRNNEQRDIELETRFTTISTPDPANLIENTADEFISNFIDRQNEEISSVDTESLRSPIYYRNIYEEVENSLNDRSTDSSETLNEPEVNNTISSQILSRIRRRDNEGDENQAFRQRSDRIYNQNIPYELINNFGENIAQNESERNIENNDDLSERISEMISLINENLYARSSIYQQGWPVPNRPSTYFNEILEIRNNELENNALTNEESEFSQTRIIQNINEEESRTMQLNLITGAMKTQNIINSTNFMSVDLPEIDNSIVISKLGVIQQNIDNSSIMSSADEENVSGLVNHDETLLIDKSCFLNTDSDFLKMKNCNQMLIRVFKHFCKILENFYIIDKKIAYTLLWIYFTNVLDAFDHLICIQIMNVLESLFFKINKRRIFTKFIKEMDCLDAYVLKNENARLYAELITEQNFSRINIEYFNFLKTANEEINENYLRCYTSWIISNNISKIYHANIILKTLLNLLNEEKYFSLFYIAKLCSNNHEIQNLCLKIGIVDKILKLYLRKFSIKTNMANIFHCIATLIELSEDNRKLICRKKIFTPLFELLKLKIKARKFDKTMLMMVHCIRNSTRCLKFVRCDLMDFPVIELLLLILSYAKKSTGGINIDLCFLAEKRCNDEIKTCSFVLLKETLITIGNLMLDFGNYRSKFMNKNGPNVVSKMHKRKNLEFYTLFIFKNLIYDSNWSLKEKLLRVFFHHKLEYNGMGDKSTQKNLIIKSEYLEIREEINIQDIIYNIDIHISKGYKFIHSDSNNFFHFVLKKHNPDKIQEKSVKSMNSLLVLEQLFILIKNFACSKKDENKVLLHNFPLILDSVIFFFVKLVDQHSFTMKNTVICEIIYIMSNLCAYNSNIRDLFASNLVLETIQKLFTSVDRRIIISLIWFMTNLSWNDGDNVLRIQKLKDYGFKDWLCQVRLIDSYINDKVVTVLDNLGV